MLVKTKRFDAINENQKDLNPHNFERAILTFIRIISKNHFGNPNQKQFKDINSDNV